MLPVQYDIIIQYYLFELLPHQILYLEREFPDLLEAIHLMLRVIKLLSVRLTQIILLHFQEH